MAGEKLNLMVVDTTPFLDDAVDIIAELVGDGFEVFGVGKVRRAILMLTDETRRTDALIMSPSMYEEETRIGSAEVLRVARNVGVGSIAFMTGLGRSQFEKLGVETVFDKGRMSDRAEREKIRKFLQEVKS